MPAPQYFDTLRKCAAGRGIAIPLSWRGVDVVLPVIEHIRADGSVIVIKMDGKRRGEQDVGQFTVVISGDALADDSIRIDSASIEEALSMAILKYAERVWNYPPSVG